MMRNLLAACALFAAASSLSLPAHAQGSVVIYRCTDANGALTVQNDRACPKGSKQEKRVIQSAQSMPAYRPMPAPKTTPHAAASAKPATPPSAPKDDEPAIADADRLPPPALYQCNTYDNDTYLSEAAEPPPRCVRLQTTGLDGSPDNGAGVACQMVTDQCQRVADGALCDAWNKRLRETEASWKFARTDDINGTQADYDRVRKIVRESTCGK